MASDPSTTLKTSGRFVLLHHCFPAGTDSEREDHFDLMLEQESALATWAIPTLPAIGQSVVAKRLPDHRKHYLNYEGPVSNDRGIVTQRLSGKYILLPTTDQSLQMWFHGVAGKWCLRIESPAKVETRLTRLEPGPDPN